MIFSSAGSVLLIIDRAVATVTLSVSVSSSYAFQTGFSPGAFRRAIRPGTALRQQIFCFFPCPVINPDVKSRLPEIPDHSVTHNAGSDETNILHKASSYF